MREFKFINFNKGKNYYLIEINRPDQLNAINKETIKELKEELEDKNFKTNLNLIQTYKSLSIAEGMRLEPNNPVFLLTGKK